MILRVFRARLKPGARTEFERLCHEMSIPFMSTLPGLVALHIAEPDAAQPEEFVLVSVWQDIASIKRFAGEDWENVVILPGEARLVEAVAVQHYDESAQDVSKLRPLMADMLKMKEDAATQTLRLSDAQWERIRPVLPSIKHAGRPRADDRRTLEGILYVIRTGCRWQDIPQQYGNGVTCWRRLAQWEADGTWERIWSTLNATADPQWKLIWPQAVRPGTVSLAKHRRQRYASAYNRKSSA